MTWMAARGRGRGRSRALRALALVALAAAGVAAEDSGDEWVSNVPGDGVEWMSFANATSEVGEKPILALVHRGYCGACKSLKATFEKDEAEYARFAALSRSFTMVSVSDADAGGRAKTRSQVLFKIPASARVPHEDKRLQPGGADYVPRVIFLSADGTPHPELTNSDGNKNYPYYYTHVGQIADAMEATLKLAWAGGASGASDGDHKKEEL